MENQRVFLWLSLGLVIWLMVQAWIADNRPPPASVEPQVPGAEQPIEAPDDLPALPATEALAQDAGLIPDLESTLPSGQRVRVITDVLDVDIDTLGGDLRRADLLAYPRRKDEPDDVVRLLDDTPPELYVLQTGLRIPERESEPNHRASFTSAAGEYALAPGAERIEVPLLWSDGSGLQVRKVFTFHRGSYRIDVSYVIDNSTGATWRGASYSQIKRRHVPVERSMVDVDSYSFRGPVFYNGRKYEKLEVDELAEQPLNMQVEDGWVATIEHHFLVAAVPAPGTSSSYQANLQGQVFQLRTVSPVLEIPPGPSQVEAPALFVGPKLQEQLREIAPTLDLTVDYGVMTIISQPLFWLLSQIHSVVGNWGWSIVMLTILIKLLFYKLQEKSGRQMAKMRKLQPKMKLLQERYKDDRQKLSQAMMDLYKREKANPVAGCLPVLVQMPVFLALYWVLLESVELRQAPFALWIDDLSVRDPYFVLPLLMGITMFAQTKLNPPPPDPMQARIMLFMPIAMSVFMAFFPAGLVLYWFTNTLLSVLQQWHINRVIEKTG